MTQSTAYSVSTTAPEAPMRQPGRLLIGICTFKRPAQLTNLLDAIATLTLPANCETPQILIVDNDPAGTARIIAESRSNSNSNSIHYLHLGATNIAAARNSVIHFAASARDQVDLLAMIDDDEIPTTTWLIELLECLERTKADVVIGRVLGQLPAETPKWIVDGHYFDVEGPAPDGPMDEGITGNALVRVNVLRKHRIRFDESLGQAGGEDQLFFRQISKLGVPIRYSEDAVVEEAVPISRCTFGFLLRKSFRTGNTLGLLDAHYPMSGRKSAALRSVKAIYWIASGAGQSILGLPRGWSATTQGVFRLVRGAGMAVGVVGFRYEFYGSRQLKWTR